jgi:TetR/AcrR family transcriptional repressor of nem operon
MSEAEARSGAGVGPGLGGREVRKAETRQRIKDAARTLFRQQGIDAVGVDAIMADAGLTHGGFYGHFPSKEALAAEVCAEALGHSAERWATLRETHGGEEALRRIVEAYLGDAALEPGKGCVVPTLGAELARRPLARPGLTAAIRSMAATLAACLPGRRETAHRRGLAALSCLVGAVILARLASEPALAEEILDSARHAVGSGGHAPS